MTGEVFSGYEDEHYSPYIHEESVDIIVQEAVDEFIATLPPIPPTDTHGEYYRHRINELLAEVNRWRDLALGWKETATHAAAAVLSQHQAIKSVRSHAICTACEGSGWECYGTGRGDPHFRPCSKCDNPEDLPCP